MNEILLTISNSLCGEDGKWRVFSEDGRTGEG